MKNILYYKLSSPTLWINWDSRFTKEVPVRSTNFDSTILSKPVSIASHVSTIIRPTNFLNHPSLDDTICKRWINPLPHRITNNNILAIPSAYVVIAKKPLKNDAGNITATINAYVGLQLLNTGPNDAQSNISPNVHPIFLDFESKRPDCVIHVQIEIVSHINGNIINNPKSIKILADIIFQTWLSIPAHTALILRRSVKAIMDNTNDHKMINILFRDSDSSHLPQITGIMGNAQGAKIVNIPAKNEMK